MLIEYDLKNCSFDNGVVILGSRTRVEQSALPKTMIWHPDTGAESFLLTVSTCILKITHICRQTTKSS